MRTAELLAAGPDFAVRAVRCRDDHTGWSPPEPSPGHGVVLVRTGRFRRAGAAGELLADRTVGYLMAPGDEERFAHPAGGDVCTAVGVSRRLWRELRGGGVEPAPGPMYVDARVDLEHRLLLRAARDGDVAFATTERLLRLLVAAVPAGDGGGRGDRRTREVTGADRRVVEAAREAIASGHPAAAGLLPLARLLGAPPHRLSRAFHRVVGVPLTRFRNRVRVAAALDRLEQGEPGLARLASDLGFADQAHLTRTVRAQLGHTPARLRRLLAPPDPGPRAGGRTPREPGTTAEPAAQKPPASASRAGRPPAALAGVESRQPR